MADVLGGDYKDQTAWAEWLAGC